MTSEREFRVYYTQIEDGSWLAASVSSPWFCLAGESKEAVKARAQRAVDFWCEHQGEPIQKRPVRTVTPFAPQVVETLRPAVCARLRPKPGHWGRTA